MEKNSVVPSSETARRVAVMLDAGITVQEIASTSHLPNEMIRRLRTRQKPIPSHVERGIELAWQYLNPVPAAPTARRVFEPVRLAGGGRGRTMGPLAGSRPIAILVEKPYGGVRVHGVPMTKG